MLSRIFYPFYHYFKEKACRRALGACWWAAVAMGWVCAGQQLALPADTITPHPTNSAAARWALPQPSGSLCKQDAIIRPAHLLLQHLTSLFLPSWEHWLSLSWSAVGCTGHGVPHNGRLRALSLSDPWVQMCLSNKHPPSREELCFWAPGEAESLSQLIHHPWSWRPVEGIHMRVFGPQVCNDSWQPSSEKLSRVGVQMWGDVDLISHTVSAV